MLDVASLSKRGGMKGSSDAPSLSPISLSFVTWRDSFCLLTDAASSLSVSKDSRLDSTTAAAAFCITGRSKLNFAISKVSVHGLLLSSSCKLTDHDMRVLCCGELSGYFGKRDLLQGALAFCR